MFLSSPALLAIFESIGKIYDSSEHDKKKRVSCLRHVLAVSLLIKQYKLHDGKVDLTPTVGLHRQAFKAAVGEIVRLNENGLYTQNFSKEFDSASDYKSSNNFLTTLVRWSGPYPSQNSNAGGAPVLKIHKLRNKRYATIADDIGQTLESEYNLPAIRTALVLWILRFNKFESSEITSFQTLKDKMNAFVNSKFDKSLSKQLQVTEASIEELFASTGLTIDLIFSDTHVDLAFLKEKFGEEESKTEDDDDENSSEDGAENLSGSSAEPYLVIFAGPPGTGKSRCTRILADLIANNAAVPADLTSLQVAAYPSTINDPNIYSTQFHPSYSYEDFMEGLRPVSVRQGNKSDTVYEVVPGVFRASSEIARALFETATTPEGAFEIEVAAGYDPTSSWQILENSSISLYRLMKRNGSFFFRGKKILDTTSAPESTFTVSEDSKPIEEGIYKIKWQANDDDVQNIVLTIDEFNRGNPAVIFGEALTALETTKRIGNIETSEILLPYSGKALKIPPNFHVIASMNTSDRNLSTIDIALKRRFKFIFLKPNFSLLDRCISNFGSNGKSVVNAVRDHFEAINKSFSEVGITIDHHVGHSYAFLVLSRLNREAINEDWSRELRKKFSDTWKYELHEVVRSILGVSGVDKFSDIFVGKILQTEWISALELDVVSVNKLVKGFLGDPAAEISWLDEAS